MHIFHILCPFTCSELDFLSLVWPLLYVKCLLCNWSKRSNILNAIAKLQMLQLTPLKENNLAPETEFKVHRKSTQRKLKILKYTALSPQSIRLTLLFYYIITCHIWYIITYPSEPWWPLSQSYNLYLSTCSIRWVLKRLRERFRWWHH